MVGTLGEGFLPNAFFAGTFDKVSDFEIVFEFKIFFGHCRHPSFASLLFYYSIENLVLWARSEFIGSAL
jgi:hypothetical protein